MIWLTCITVLSVPAPERKTEWWAHAGNISCRWKTKPWSWIKRPCYFCQVGFESAGRQGLEWKLSTNTGQVSAVTRLTDRSIQHCAGKRGLFIESGGKALSAHYQTTYALHHFLFICFSQHGIAKTKPFLSFHLFNLCLFDLFSGGR